MNACHAQQCFRQTSTFQIKVYYGYVDLNLAAYGLLNSPIRYIMISQGQVCHSQPVIPTFEKAESPTLILGKIYAADYLSTSCLTTLSQQQHTFKNHWTIITRRRNLQIQACKSHQKKYHQNKNTLQKNITESLNSTENKSIFCYLIHSVWIPYVHQKYMILMVVNPSAWVQEFCQDFKQLMEIIVEYAGQHYPQEEGKRRNAEEDLFKIISQYMTSHPMWQRVDEVFVRIMSRLKYALRLNKNIGPELFELQIERFQDISFRKEVMLLRDAYSIPSIRGKKQKILEFKKLVLQSRRFNFQQIGKAIQYCLLLSGCEGFSEMVEYIVFLDRSEGQEKEFLEAVKAHVKRLLTRDTTGFSNYGVERYNNQYKLNRESWRFLYNKCSCFQFLNPFKVFHIEPTWQTLISWNYLKPKCELRLAVDVPNNFIKLGIIVGDHENCRDESRSSRVLAYCFSSGVFHKFMQQSTHMSFKEQPLTCLKLRVDNNKILWQAQTQTQSVEVVSYQLSEQTIEKARVIIIFRKGSLEAFPSQQ